MRTWDAPDVEVREVADAPRAPAGGDGCVCPYIYVCVSLMSKSKSWADHDHVNLQTCIYV